MTRSDWRCVFRLRESGHTVYPFDSMSTLVPRVLRSTRSRLGPVAPMSSVHKGTRVHRFLGPFRPGCDSTSVLRSLSPVTVCPTTEALRSGSPYSLPLFLVSLSPVLSFGHPLHTPVPSGPPPRPESCSGPLLFGERQVSRYGRHSGWGRWGRVPGGWGRRGTGGRVTPGSSVVG